MKTRKWIDVTVTLKSGMVHWPSDPRVSVVRTKDMDRGDRNNVSLISMGTHTGTHIDAPLHFIARGKGLDKMPFSATLGKVRVLGIEGGPMITSAELRPYRIKPGERIIFKTVNSAYWATDDFRKDFVYLSQDAALYLASKRLSCLGVDYLSVGGYHKDGTKVHETLLKAGIWLIEGLNLQKVKPGNYELICLPLKILNSDAAPARAIISPV